MSPTDTTVQEEYVAARRALLDALMALETQRAAIVLAGAQAIYVRTGGGSLPISDFTSDGDLALDPACLAETPTLGESMENADFKLATRGGAEEPGIWEKDATFDGQPGKVQIDLIVPAEIAPPGGTRGARLPFHGKRAARKVSGLEGAIVENEPMLIKALDPTDPRAATVRVAGFAALLVAKSHKIKDRVDSGREDRVNVKDASDVVQIMNAVNPETMAADLELLGKHPVAAASTRSGLEAFRSLFGNRAGAGIEMAVQSLERAMAEETVRAICLAYAEGLEQALNL